MGIQGMRSGEKEGGSLVDAVDWDDVVADAALERLEFESMVMILSVQFGVWC